MTRIGWWVLGMLGALVLAGCGGAPQPASTSAAAKPAAATTGLSAPPPPPAAIAPAAAVPATAAARSPLSPPVAVKAAAISISSEAPLYIALERGYFQDEGLDVELITGNSPSTYLPSLATGQLDVGNIVADPAVFNALARGVDLKIVGYYEVVTPSNRALQVMVRQDVVESGRYREPADLKGMEIALNNPASQGSYVLSRGLARAGLAMGDVNLVALPFPDMIAALTNKRVEAAVSVQPFALQIESQRIATPVLSAGELVPGIPQMMLAYGGPFIQREPEAAKRFMVGFMRAQRDLWHAFDKEDGDKQAIYQILTKYTGVKDLALNEAVGQTGVVSGTLPNGEMPTESLDQFQAYFVGNGTQQTAVDLKGVVDPTYASYAVEQLGRVAP